MELNNFYLQKPFRKSPVVLTGLFLLMSMALLFLSVRVLDPGRSRARAPYLTPPEMQHFAFGAKEQMADGLWLRALQDFDYCEQKAKDKTCREGGWVYRMLDLITDLAPSFRMPYATGGLALTVLVNDIAGASRFFDKAVKAFPEDPAILMRAAYQALYEEKNRMKAASLMEKAAQHGAPPWYYMLAMRLAKEDGDQVFGDALIAHLEHEPRSDPLLVEALKKRLSEIKTKPPGASN